MVEDIMANNNLVEAGFINREDIIMSNLYTQPSQNFFNMKDYLLHNNRAYFDSASECLSDKDDEDKIEFDMDFDRVSNFSTEQERQAMLDFLRLRSPNDHEVGGTWNPVAR